MSTVTPSFSSLPISLVIITLNEEKNIERCIRSVPFADEVIVVDSGSSDRTVALAEACGAKVMHHNWAGYSKQKTFATQIARNDLILSLDADEALSAEAAAELTKLLSTKLTADAYALPRMVFYLGRWMKYGGMYPDYQTRVFDRRKCHWLDSEVHEHIVANSIVRLKQPILHWSFENLSQQLDTVNRYTSLRAIDLLKNNKKFSWIKLIGKPISKFFETYFVKLGFLDGTPGLIASGVTVFATFLNWAKLYELRRLQQKN